MQEQEREFPVHIRKEQGGHGYRVVAGYRRLALLASQTRPPSVPAIELGSGNRHTLVFVAGRYRLQHATPGEPRPEDSRTSLSVRR